MKECTSEKGVRILTAETAGFCYGVQRAVDAVYEEIGKNQGSGRSIYTYGEIVHNEQVVKAFSGLGVRVIEDETQLEALSEAGALTGAAVVIRAHGISPAVRGKLEASGAIVRDATCPFVRKIHRIAAEHSAAGEQIVITGSAGHPEVIGILGEAKGRADVVESPEEAWAYEPPEKKKICLVSQTTFNLQKFEYIVEIFKKKFYDVNVVNTICNATQMRQKEAAELGSVCDAVIVIGGKNSSNTRKLYDVCCSLCEATYYVQSVTDLEGMKVSSVRCVGITAGASTPKSIIEEVQNYVRNEF